MPNFKNYLLISGCLFSFNAQASLTLLEENTALINSGKTHSCQHSDVSADQEGVEIDLAHSTPQQPYVDLETLKTKLKNSGNKAISLDISDNLMKDEALIEISNYPQLQKLYLQDNLFTDEGAEFLKVFRDISEINLSNTRITEKGIKFLPLDKLEVLEADFLKLGNEGIIYISKAPKIRHLNIYGVGIDDQAVHILSKMKTLEILSVSYNSINSSIIDQLKIALPKTKIIAEYMQKS